MRSQRTLSVLTYLIAGLSFVSCLLSISNNDMYQDGAWAKAQWLGQDMVTILLALPLLLVSFFKARRTGDQRWIMVYSGILLYYGYSYSFFMFAANLSVLYLFHLPIFGLSVIGLVIACIGLFNQKSKYALKGRGRKGALIIYLVLISVMISFLWLNDIISHFMIPAYTSDTPDGQAPLIIYSLDLALIIPLMITSAVLLYRNTNWGYLLGGIILTKTSMLGFALMAMALSMFIQELDPDVGLIVLWCIIGIIGSLLTITYLTNLKIESGSSS